jgi:hypothetical protein
VPCAHTPEGRRAAAVRVAVPHDVHSDVGLVVGVTVVGVAGCARCLPVARELRVVEGCPPLGDEWRLRGLDGRQPLARPQPVAGARAQVTMTRLSRTRLSNDLVVLDPRTGEIVRRMPGSAIPIRSASAPTGDGSWRPRSASTGWTSIASTVRSSRWLRASPWGGTEPPRLLERQPHCVRHRAGQQPARGDRSRAPRAALDGGHRAAARWGMDDAGDTALLVGLTGSNAVAVHDPATGTRNEAPRDRQGRPQLPCRGRRATGARQQPRGQHRLCHRPGRATELC